MAVSPNIQKKDFWSLETEEVIKALDTNIKDGLSTKEAQNRLASFGLNTFESSRETSKLKVFINQLKTPLILILIFAGVVTVSISHYRDAIFIFIAVVVNAILGFWQENKAERALAELKTYLRQRARVIRNGKEKEIDAEEIIPGDILRLSQGDRVSADARILFENDLQIDESILTGESLPVSKESSVSDKNASIADQLSMVFAGTLVIQGVCSAVVCRTGLDTEIGKIAKLIASSENEKTPLQKEIIKFSLFLSILIGILTFLVFIIGVLSGKPFLEMFLTSVAIAVSAIPEGLPVSMTVILAVGVERMAKRKGVVRKLIVAEALGSATTILTDKTGTLTEASMVLSKIIPLGGREEKEILKRALINAEVLIENPEDKPADWRMDGRIMEVALYRSAVLFGVSPQDIQDKSNLLQTIPFNAVNKYSASLISEKNGKHIIVFFGAPDILLAHSLLNQKERNDLYNQINELAFSGERVLGLATKEIDDIKDFSLSKDLTLSRLSFCGLLAFRDPIRQGIKKTIGRIKKAGIKTVIMTGDHKGTAVSVAKEIGIYTSTNSVLDASELVSLSDAEIQNRLPDISVISRVTPYDKLRIARLYQKMGEAIAMTGDGVNDAPSIKQANIGIAMGSGTEVARSVADLVLLDDNFETIVAAIEEGRQILGNIRKVLVYLLSNVMDGLILIGGSIVVGVPLPLNALQILWVNFFSDSFPAVAFAFEKDADSLSHRPEGKEAKLFNPMTKFLILVMGISTSALLFVIYILLLKFDFNLEIVQTFTFAAFGTYTLLLAFSVRSLDKSVLSYPLFSNRYLSGGILIGFLLMAVAIYVPGLQTLFGTVPLSFPWVVGVFLIGIFNMILIEIGKIIFRVGKN